MKKATMSEKSIRQALTDPKYADFATELMMLEENQDKIFYQSKYLAAQKDYLFEKIERIRKTQPRLPLKDVLSVLLKGVPENVSSNMLLEITRFIITEWENAPEMATATR
jgi:hypothetical protein